MIVGLVCVYPKPIAKVSVVTQQPKCTIIQQVTMLPPSYIFLQCSAPSHQCQTLHRNEIGISGFAQGHTKSVGLRHEHCNSSE